MKQTFLRSDLVGSEGLVSRPVRFNPKRSHLHNEQEIGWVPLSDWSLEGIKYKYILSQLKIEQ
jgi:hypothetical protein